MAVEVGRAFCGRCGIPMVQSFMTCTGGYCGFLRKRCALDCDVAFGVADWAVVVGAFNRSFNMIYVRRVECVPGGGSGGKMR